MQRNPLAHTVAYQGVPGAYSEMAARKAVPDCDPLPCEQFEVAFQALERWLADRAVLPIENSLGGSIHAVYDLLIRCAGLAERAAHCCWGNTLQPGQCVGKQKVIALCHTAMPLNSRTSRPCLHHWIIHSGPQKDIEGRCEAWRNKYLHEDAQPCTCMCLQVSVAQQQHLSAH